MTRFWVASSYGYSPESSKYFAEHPLPVDRGSITGRVTAEGKVIYLPDVLADPEYRATGWQQAAGYRTVLGHYATARRSAYSLARATL